MNKYYLSRFVKGLKPIITIHPTFEDAVLALQDEFADHRVCNHLEVQLGLDREGFVGISCASWRRPTETRTRWIRNDKKHGWQEVFEKPASPRGWREQECAFDKPNSALDALVPKNPYLNAMLIMSEAHMVGVIQDGLWEGNDRTAEIEAMRLAKVA